MTFRKTTLILAAVTLLLGGCTQVLTNVAQKAYEDRTTEDQVTDGKVEASFLNKLSSKDKGLLLDVGIDVWEQRVLLSGVVESKSVAQDIVAMARADKRVKKLYNHISVVTPAQVEARRKAAEQKDGGDSNSNSNDFWLETKIKGQLLTAKGVTSVNYRWRSVLNHVFILGKAAAVGERDRVLALLRDVKGAKSVTQYITGK